MFYSQSLLSRKGTLGTVWVAAHCLKRVKKAQVAQTNISSSVDKILLDEVPVVSYRVLAYLLLGVVRIYSKKIEYLFHDCNRVLVKMKDFSGSKKASMQIEAICAPYLSITRPKRFELDTFDLQIVEDGSGSNVRPDKDIVLADARENVGSGHYSFDKSHCEEGAEHFETSLILYTPVKDVLSPYIMGIDVVGSPSPNLSNSEASIEKIRGNNFSLEERLDPMSLPEFDEECKEPGFDRPFGEKCQTDIEHTNISDATYVLTLTAEEEPPDPVKSFNEEQDMNAEQISFPEMISSESGKHHSTPKVHPVSITIDVTPPSNCPNASGATTPEFMVVRTPATREPARVSRKRKCLFDGIIVLPNKVVKESIDDSSDLVCKRRKAPHTALHAWKTHRISNLPHTFSEPLIPCNSLELRSLFWKNKILKTPEAVKPVEALEKIGQIESPTVRIPPDETDIAPSTPVTGSTSSRLREVKEITNLDRVDPASSFVSIEKVSSPSEDKEFDFSLINEVTNSCEGDGQQMNAWSIRTRTLATYLRTSFLNRSKLRGDAVVNLSQVLKRKSKSENARVFYEILVLKTGGYIDVKQHGPYEDILVLETPKLIESPESSDRRLSFNVF